MKDTSTQLLALIRDLLRELHPDREVARLPLDSRLTEDLGLDSLAQVELLGRMERAFSVTIPEQVFARVETVRDLLRAVESAAPSSLSDRTGSEPSVQTPPPSFSPETNPHRADTLLEVLDHHVRMHPDRPHIRFYNDTGTGETLTYARLRSEAEKTACGLRSFGVQPEEPVPLMLGSEPDYFFTFFGILMAGGIPVPLYPPFKPSRIRDHLLRQKSILNNCGPTLLVAMDEAVGAARLLKAQVNSLKRIVTPAELRRESGSAPAPSLSGRETALLQYTSGSTGIPKGVILTHANLLANIRAMGSRIRATDRDVFVSWLPLYHDMGLIGAWLGSLYYGARLVLMSPLAFITRPVRWLRAIHEHGGTLSAAPNFAYSLCVHKIQDRDLAGLDLHSWRGAFNGAEPVSPDTAERFCARFEKNGFRPTAMMPVYGLAECSVGLTFPPPGRTMLTDRISRIRLQRDNLARPAGPDESAPLVFVSSGRPLDGHEIRIADDSGRELPDRRQGRLQFRGPSATSGYYRNPDRTAELFRDGWLDSGDLGYMAEGELFITGRSKDIIIRAGRNMYPEELEEAVGDLPGIRKGSVAVFSSCRTDRETEQIVVLAETAETSPRLLEKLRGSISRLASELLEIPPDVVILARPGTVPKTSSGKIRRSSCRELYRQGRLLKGKGPVWWQVIRLALAGTGPALRKGERRSAEYAYAAWAWTMFYLFGVLVFVGAGLLPGLSRRLRFAGTAARALGKTTCIPVAVHGLAHLHGIGPCIIACNHASYVDGYVLAGVLPVLPAFVAKVELTGHPVIRFLLRRLDAQFVERFDAVQSARDAERLTRAAKQGRTLVFFAEGTFSREPGLRPFHMGGFVAAAESGLPVVPVALRGTRSVLRSESWFPRRGPITVRIGPPIHPRALPPDPDRTSWQTAVRLRDLSRKFILAHCGEPDLTGNSGAPAPGSFDVFH
ncbi:MAG TPA: AMP-binding protein [Desulfomicrobiaceae bacterium]|nr:AMP-binding protein [Desulfomicrobiaceae bacterium]